MSSLFDLRALPEVHWDKSCMDAITEPGLYHLIGTGSVIGRFDGANWEVLASFSPFSKGFYDYRLGKVVEFLDV